MSNRERSRTRRIFQLRVEGSGNWNAPHPRLFLTSGSRPQASATARSPGLKKQGGESLRPCLPAAFLPQPRRRRPRKPRPAAPPSPAALGLGPPEAEPGRSGLGPEPVTHLGCQSFQLRGYLPRPRGSAAHYLPRHDMAKRRRPKKRESPPEPAAADTPLRPGAEEEAEEKEEEEEEEAEGGGGGRPFRDEEAGAAWGGDVSSRTAREDENREEAVAAAPHAHTATASPPPGSARRAAAAARHAGSEGWCRRPLGLGRWAGPVDGGGQTAPPPMSPGSWADRGSPLPRPHTFLPESTGSPGAGQSDLRFRGLACPCIHVRPPYPCLEGKKRKGSTYDH
ncbi:hypothetical protein P7K49_023069 [Saguinus oedipus]|uniref:Uncharacterized protein n=1 Tax=Saguinus oedipus TaxID=9490 RepID=A0ABQ9UKP7_SAGOE|nr:hypothetical protein P7K49_023069 [Saguinus oedipus]